MFNSPYSSTKPPLFCRNEQKLDTLHSRRQRGRGCFDSLHLVIFGKFGEKKVFFFCEYATFRSLIAKIFFQTLSSYFPY